MQVGVGTDYGKTAPQMLVRISRDGGKTWGTRGDGSDGLEGIYSSA